MPPKLNPAELASYGIDQSVKKETNPETAKPQDYQDGRPRAYAAKSSDEPRERVAEPMPSSATGADGGQSTNVVYRKVWGAPQMRPEADEKGNQ